MSEYFLRIELHSDTTFGRGDGVAGLIDAEVEHDEDGLPFLRGRTLKGLLQEECANLLFSFEELGVASFQESANRLFGKAGSDLHADAEMHVGDAVLPKDLCEAIHYEINKRDADLKWEEVLESLTTIRRQTAMTETGAPRKESLRSMRVVLRETVFEAPLSFTFDFENSDKEMYLLGACAASLRRIGLGRNRGRGKVSVQLFKDEEPLTETCLKKLGEMLPEKEFGK